MAESARTAAPPNAPAAAATGPAPQGTRLVDVVELVDTLLSPEGCPWDREQTLESLRPYLMEEASEVLEALDQGDPGAHCEELGDVLFQIVFHAALRARAGEFDIDDVCTRITEKMKRRHPHVFHETRVKDADEVVENWGKIKEQERAAKGLGKRRLLDGVPAGLPALHRAQKLGEKAAKVGFDWPDVQGVRDKISEELDELDEALGKNDRGQIEHELGDLLFTLTRLGSKLGIPPEDALRKANQRFIQRVSTMEDAVERDGKALAGMSLDEMDGYWERAKRELGS